MKTGGTEPSLGYVITEIYAFCAADDKGEGLAGMHTGEGWMPMVGADMERMKSILPIAKMIAKESGRKIKLKKFKLVSEEEI